MVTKHNLCLIKNNYQITYSYLYRSPLVRSRGVGGEVVRWLFVLRCQVFVNWQVRIISMFSVRCWHPTMAF